MSSTDKELQALYNNPAVVYAMNLLEDLGVNGAIYDELVSFRWHPDNVDGLCVTASPPSSDGQPKASTSGTATGVGAQRKGSSMTRSSTMGSSTGKKMGIRRRKKDNMPAGSEKPQMNLIKLSTIAVAAVLVAVPATAVAVAPAYADCGDPDQPPCTGPVPTVDEGVAVLAGLTDPDIPAANKTNIVTPGFTPEEAGTIDDHLNRDVLHCRGEDRFRPDGAD
jgi:hypothetical protein